MYGLAENRIYRKHTTCSSRMCINGLYSNYGVIADITIELGCLLSLNITGHRTAGCSGVVVDSCALCDENPGSNRARRDISGREAAA